MATLSIRRSGITELTRVDIVRFVSKTAESVEKVAQAKSPKDTGKLSRSIKAGKTRVRGFQVRAKVSTKTRYGLYPEIGTGIYGPTGRVIKPKSKPFLLSLLRRYSG